MDRTDLSPADLSPATLSPDASADRSASRRGFLRSTAIAGLVATPLVAAFGNAANAGFTGSVQDVAAGRKQFKQIEKQFRSIRAHENTHVSYLVSALGAAARPKPKFQKLEQKDYSAFVAVSQALENTGVAAYSGAGPILFTKAYLAAALSIATVESRHAGWLDDLRNQSLTVSPANDGSDPAFDRPYTAAQVRAAAGGFIKSLNGGPALEFSTTPSANNDVAILNFALALEYLEAEFYNINVPKFFGGD